MKIAHVNRACTIASICSNVYGHTPIPTCMSEGGLLTLARGAEGYCSWLVCVCVCVCVCVLGGGLLS